MQSAKFAALLALPALLTGCGGGGSDDGGNSTPPAPAKYTVNFVALSTSSSTNIGSCAIYGTDNQNAPSAYIKASKAIGQNLSIYIHDNTGATVAGPYNQTNWSNGSFTFNQSTVPTDGYLSIVATNSAGLNVGYDILTLEKSLIPTSFTVNAKGEVATGSCIAGASNTLPSNYIGYINDDGDPNDGLFGYHSTTEEISSTSPSNIAFKSLSNQQILAARWCRNGTSGCNVGELLKYKFANTTQAGSAGTPLLLEDVTNTANSWTVNTDATVTSANLAIYRAGTGAIKWQDLLTNANGTYSYAAELSSDYYLSIAGSHKQWDFSYTTNVIDVANGIDESTTLTNLGVPDRNTSALTLSACSTSATGYCAEGYDSAAPSSINVQRTLVAASSGNNSVSQSFYSKANEMLPLMKFDNNIDSIWAANLQKIEVSLFENRNNSNLNSTFLSSFFDAYKVTTSNYGGVSYTDTITVIQTSKAREDNENTLAHSNFKIFNSKL